MLKQITFDTSHSTVSEVETAIFLPEHTECLDVKINHLARPHWGTHWAPNLLLFYFLHCSCQRARDLLTVSIALRRLQLLMTSTRSVGTSGVVFFFCSVSVLFVVFLHQRDTRYPAKISFLPHNSIFALNANPAYFNHCEILHLSLTF